MPHLEFDHDLHIHTALSACCREKEAQTPDPVISLAREMGLHTIGLADHAWANPEIQPSPWYRAQDESRITELAEKTRAHSSGPRVLVGCEAETIAPGKFGIDRRFADRVDFVLLACSHFHMTGFVAQPESDSPPHLARHMIDFFRSAVTSGLATVIPHPLLPLGFFEVFDRAVETISDGEFADAFGLAAEKGVALEVTTSYLPGDYKVHSIETPIRILTLARQAGCFFTLATDAHDPQKQRTLPELVRLAVPAGIGPKNILPLVRKPVSAA